jgi:hypothetical protein
VGKGTTVENIGAAHTDSMVAGWAVPFSIVGLFVLRGKRKTA